MKRIFRLVYMAYTNIRIAEKKNAKVNEILNTKFYIKVGIYLSIILYIIVIIIVTQMNRENSSAMLFGTFT